MQTSHCVHTVFDIINKSHRVTKIFSSGQYIRLRMANHSGIQAKWVAPICKNLFNEKLNQLEFPSWDFNLHSLRAGEATAAANAKVLDWAYSETWKMEIQKCQR